MGKVVLEFDSIEEQTEIMDALNGYKWRMAMDELDQHLRAVVKYEKDNPTEEQMDFADNLRDTIREILSSYQLTFE